MGTLFEEMRNYKTKRRHSSRRGRLQIRSLKKLKSDRCRQVRFLTEDEIQRVLQEADGFMRKAILISLYSSLRRSEFVYLEWKDIDFDNGQIYVQSKPEFGLHPKKLQTSVNPYVQGVSNLLMDIPEAGKFVFDNRHDEPLHHPNTHYKEIMKICRKAWKRGANLRTLRHTFASHLIMKGVNPRTVQEHLGHSSIQITEKYSHVAKIHKREAINVLSYGGQVETKLKQIEEASR